jgi:hypothetical protein
VILSKCRNSHWNTGGFPGSSPDTEYETGRLVKQVELRGLIYPESEEIGIFRATHIERQTKWRTVCASPAGISKRGVNTGFGYGLK